jgi:L-lysine epsilon oxidase-like protein
MQVVVHAKVECVMDLIQFRIHPSVGMARFGVSTAWYFLGPEIPRFIQEQFPRLRQQPQPRRHPAPAHSDAEADTLKPDAGRYRDKGNSTMPQAARFRVFAYVYSRGDSEPYRVMELKPEHADIEWTVTVANAKSVSADDKAVDPNEPGARPLATKASSPPANCQTGSLPNLAWLALEKDAGGSQTGRLLVIGNEGDADGGAFKPDPTPADSFPRPFLFQNAWHDPAADGPVEATVELKPAFKSLFPGFKYFVPGQKDPMALPSDSKVAAVPAWVVVNVPDYLPDMGHFISLWDLALNQAWKFVADGGNAKAVDGQHHLAIAKNEVNSYVFYDYYTHIYPQLGLFSDLAYVSGQVRAGSEESENTGGSFSTHGAFTRGITLRGDLTADATATTIKITVDEALRLKVASLGQPFLVLLSSDAANPFADAAHEFVRCSSMGNDGVLAVARAQEGTAAGSWPTGTHYFAATKAGFLETQLRAAMNADASDTQLLVDTQSAHKMPEPTPAGPNARDSPFKIALSRAGGIEWLQCTSNAKAADAPTGGGGTTVVGRLTVARGQDGTAVAGWSSGDTLIAPALGHKKLDARARVAALATGLGGPIPQLLFKRLRLPKTVYDRKTFKKHPDDPANPGNNRPATRYPREFGQRMEFGTVSQDPDFDTAVDVDPGGSVSRFHNIFTASAGKSPPQACKGGPLTPDTGKSLPPRLPTDTHHLGTSPVTDAAHVDQLDDYYWIVSERDMPLLKEYAFTHIQYNQFEYWATGKMEKGHYTRWAPLFEVIFKGSRLATFFGEAHSREEYIDQLLKQRPLYGPAFLDMASLGKMLGGSFLPGIEVGREGGIPKNWSLYHGGTVYFPDLRFHPQGSATPHRPGTLTKDLAVPWFADYIGCVENFWPTSRPQVVYQKNDVPYAWLEIKEHAHNDADFRAYWKRVGFIRRQTTGEFFDTATGEFFEEEALLHRP